MLRENIEKRFVHQRFATKNSEEIGTFLLRFGNNAVDLFGGQAFLLLFACHPASLTMQIAIVGNRNEVKSRKKLPVFQSFFVVVKCAHPFQSHVENEFVHAAGVGVQYLFNHDFYLMFFVSQPMLISVLFRLAELPKLSILTIAWHYGQTTVRRCFPEQSLFPFSEFRVRCPK